MQEDDYRWFWGEKELKSKQTISQGQTVHDFKDYDKLCVVWASATWDHLQQQLRSSENPLERTSIRAITRSFHRPSFQTKYVFALKWVIIKMIGWLKGWIQDRLGDVKCGLELLNLIDAVKYFDRQLSTFENIKLMPCIDQTFKERAVMLTSVSPLPQPLNNPRDNGVIGDVFWMPENLPSILSQYPELLKWSMKTLQVILDYNLLKDGFKLDEPLDQCLSILENDLSDSQIKQDLLNFFFSKRLS